MITVPLRQVFKLDDDYGSSSYIAVPGEGAVTTVGNTQSLALSDSITASVLPSNGMCYRATIKVVAQPEISRQIFRVDIVDGSFSSGWAVQVEVSTKSETDPDTQEVTYPGPVVYKSVVYDLGAFPNGVLAESAELPLPGDGYLGIAAKMNGTELSVSVNGGEVLTVAPGQTTITATAVGLFMQNIQGASTDNPTLALRELSIYPVDFWTAAELPTHSLPNKDAIGPFEPFDPEVSNLPPATLVLDFVTEAYTLDGSSVALADIFETGTFGYHSAIVPTTTAGAGCVVAANGTGGGSFTLNVSESEKFLDGFILIADVELAVTHTGSWCQSLFGLVVGDQPIRSEYWQFQIEANDYNNSTTYYGISVTDNRDLWETQEIVTPPVDGVYRIAGRVDAAGNMAMSVNGGPLLTGVSYPMFYRNIVWADLYANNGASATLNKLQLLPLASHSEADLPGLSAL